VVIKLNHRDLEVGEIFGRSNREDSEQQPKFAARYSIELIASNSKVGEVFVGLTQIADDVALTWMPTFYE